MLNGVMETSYEILQMEALIDEHLALAYTEHSGRSAITLMGDRGVALRQTLIAIAGGNQLHEHDSPGEATIYVLRGEATFTVGEREFAMGQGDYFVIPPVRHGVTAVTDCALLLSVAKRVTH